MNQITVPQLFLILKIRSDITPPFSENSDIVIGATPGLASLAYAHSDSAWKSLIGKVQLLAGWEGRLGTCNRYTLPLSDSERQKTRHRF